MKFVLDDLLPQSDSAYEPPSNLSELFTGEDSALWELADIWKYGLSDMSTEDRAIFTMGYYCAIWDVWLKTGLPFAVTVPEDCVDRLVKRSEAFNRTVEAKPSGNSGNIQMIVSAHNGDK